jgi:hypothetical protein
MWQMRLLRDLIKSDESFGEASKLWMESWWVEWGKESHWYWLQFLRFLWRKSSIILHILIEIVEEDENRVGKNKEIWSEDVFRQMDRCLRKTSVLCRTDLQLSIAGWKISIYFAFSLSHCCFHQQFMQFPNLVSC